MNCLIINSTHFDTTSSNRFVYKFPQSIKFEKGYSVGLQSLKMYNSIFNIEAVRGNNTFSIIWNAATPVTYNFTIPDSYMSVSQLNYYVQQQCILNNLYVTDANGNYIYFVELVTNATRYACQINSYVLPTSATATTLGWTKPSGATWNFPASAQTVQFVIPTTAFGNLLGLEAATYPSTIQATNQQFLSSKTPQISPVNSIILTCNLIQSKYANPVNAFYSVPITVAVGDTIVLENSSPIFNTITEGLYSGVVIELLDQSFNRLRLHDIELVITLAIKDPVGV